MCQDFFFDLAKPFFAVVHLVAHEKSGNSEGTAFDRVHSVVQQFLFNGFVLGSGHKIGTVETGFRERVDYDFGIVHFQANLPHCLEGDFAVLGEPSIQLGHDRAAQTVKVNWPAGLSEVFTDLDPGRVTTLQEGRGEAVP